jgi:hypothetical protein
VNTIRADVDAADVGQPSYDRMCRSGSRKSCDSPRSAESCAGYPPIGADRSLR